MRGPRALQRASGARRRSASGAAARPGSAGGALLAVAIAGLLFAGCTEEALTGPGPDEGDRPPSSTVELVVPADEMRVWRDSTFTGFALPTDAPFLLLADEPPFRSNTLVRYTGVPDSVEVDSVDHAVEEFVSGQLRVVVDTARSRVGGGNVTLRFFSLGQRFDPEEADWTRAAEGRTWSSPGGDFETELGSVDLSGFDDSALGDTVVISLRDAVTDSILQEWASGNGQPGAGLRLDGEDTRLTVLAADLRMEIAPAELDTTVRRTANGVPTAIPSTFIFDPPPPGPGSDLRLGGLPANRFYLEFDPPRTVDGIDLLGARINRAELVFPPLSSPPPGYVWTHPVRATGIELGADPFELGARTPIGDTLQSGSVAVNADSLATGSPVRFGFTNLMSRWASNPDSVGTFRVGVRLRPDTQGIGFWDFGSEESPAAVRPFLRIVVTPPSDFDVP